MENGKYEMWNCCLLNLTDPFGPTLSQQTFIWHASCIFLNELREVFMLQIVFVTIPYGRIRRILNHYNLQKNL